MLPFTELVAQPCVVTETGTTEHNDWCMKEHIPSVWLWDQWVGVAPTHVLGTAPTLVLFGCENGFDPSSVWLED